MKRRPRSLMGLIFVWVRMRCGSTFTPVIALIVCLVTAIALLTQHKATPAQAQATARPRPKHTTIGAPAVVFGNGAWLLVWQRTRADGNYELLAAILDETRWSLKEPPHVLAQLARTYVTGLRAAWDGAHFAVVWQVKVPGSVFTYDGFFAQLDHHAQRTREITKLPSSIVMSVPSIACTRTLCGVVWTQPDPLREFGSEVVYLAFDPSGRALGEKTVINARSGGLARATIATRSDGFHVAWGEWDASEHFQTTVRRVRFNGVADTLREVSWNRDEVRTFAWADDGTSTRITTFSNESFKFARLGLENDPLPPTHVSDGRDGRPWEPRLETMGDASIATWVESSSAQKREGYLVRVGRSGVLETSIVRVTAECPHVGSDLAVGWNGSTLLMTWYPTNTDGMRVPMVARVDPKSLRPTHTLRLSDWERAYHPR